VTLPSQTYMSEDGARLLDAFKNAYRALYRRSIRDVDVKVLSCVLAVSALVAVDFGSQLLFLFRFRFSFRCRRFTGRAGVRRFPCQSLFSQSCRFCGVG